MKEVINNKIKEAVILAAGNRKDFDRPVGFLEIEDFKVIERIIKILKQNGIEKIVIVTGYKSEYFEQLKSFDNTIHIVKNDYYKWTGNMASLALAEKELEGDFLIIENDLVFEDVAIERIINSSYKDCVLITNESGSGDEAFVEIRENYLYKISKDIHQFNKIDGEMIGISKISKEFFKLMLEEFSMNMNPYVNYEYIILDISREHRVGVEKIIDLVWGEIDNKNQYEMLIKNIMPRLRRKEISTRIEEVKNVLINNLDIKREEISLVYPIGGMTNNNYKARVKEKEYVIRIPGAGTNEMIDRKSEAINSSLVAKAGIDAEILYYDVNTGTKISAMIEGAETINPAMAKMQINMKKITDILRKLHNSNLEMKNEFNVFKYIKEYESLLNKFNGKYYDEYSEVREKVMSLETILKNNGAYLAPCHCDTVPENFIKDKNGKMYLIDWEYSGLNDPMWDLAAHSIECEFSQEDEELMLKMYFEGKEDKNSKNRLQIYKICQDLLWSIWTRIKEEQGEDFGTYGLDRFNRCKKALNKVLGENI